MMNRLPTHAWVAFGPRGEMAGVESSEAQAASRAYLAEHSLAETVEEWLR